MPELYSKTNMSFGIDLYFFYSLNITKRIIKDIFFIRCHRSIPSLFFYIQLKVNIDVSLRLNMHLQINGLLIGCTDWKFWHMCGLAVDLDLQVVTEEETLLEMVLDKSCIAFLRG